MARIVYDVKIVDDIEVNRDGLEVDYYHESNKNISGSGKLETINNYGGVKIIFHAIFNEETYNDLIAWWHWARRGQRFAFVADTTKVTLAILDGAAASGQKTIPVDTTIGFFAGDFCLIRSVARDDEYEIVMIASVNDGVSVLAVDDLKYAYAASDVLRHDNFFPTVICMNETFEPEKIGSSYFYDFEFDEDLIDFTVLNAPWPETAPNYTNALAGTLSGGKILRSTDYGATWIDLGQQGSVSIVMALVYLGNGVVLAGSGFNANIFRSTDYGATWIDLGSQFSEYEIRDFCYIGNGIVLAGTSRSGKILRSTDYGATWIDLGQQFSESRVYYLEYLGNGIVLAGTGLTGHILRSTDYGATWGDLGQQYSQVWVHCFAYMGSGIVIAGTATGGKILRSTDYGASWSDLGQQGSQSHIFTLCNLGNGIALTGTYPSAKILRSTDYGVTWSDLGQQFSQSYIFFLFDLGNGIVLAGTGSGGKILRSTDYGATWNDLGQQFGESQIRSLTGV